MEVPAPPGAKKAEADAARAAAEGHDPDETIPESTLPLDQQASWLEAATQEIQKIESGRKKADAEYAKAVAESLMAATRPSATPHGDDVVKRHFQPGEAGRRGKGWGLNTENAPHRDMPERTRGSVSLWDNLKRIKEDTGAATVEDAFAIVGASQAAPIPAFMDQLLGFHEAVRRELVAWPGWVGEMLAEVPIRQAADALLSDRERQIVRPDHPDYDHAMGVILARKLAAARGAWEADVERSHKSEPVPPTGEWGKTSMGRFLGEGFRTWAAYAKAAAARGFNAGWEFSTRRKSPREFFKTAVYKAEIERGSFADDVAIEAAATKALGEQHRPDGWAKGLQWSDVITPQGFDVLWRAWEMQHGVLGEAEIAAAAARGRGLFKGINRITELQRVRGELKPIEAERIMRAFAEGDWATLEALGVTRTTIAKTATVGKDDTKPPAADVPPGSPWAEDITGPDYVNRQRFVERHQDIAVRVLDLARSKGIGDIESRSYRPLHDAIDIDPDKVVPRSLRVWLDIANDESASAVNRRDAFVHALDETIRAGGGPSEMFDVVTRPRELPDGLNKFADVWRRQSVAAINEARKAGWVVENGDTLAPSPEVLLEVMKLRKHKGIPDDWDRQSGFHGQGSIWGSVCWSDCAVAGKNLDDAANEADKRAREAKTAEEREDAYKAKRWFQRLRGSFDRTRNWMAEFTASYAGEYSRPANEEKARGFGRHLRSAYEQHGPLVTNALMKTNEEKLALADVFQGGLYTVARKWGYTTEFKKFYDIHPDDWTPAMHEEFASRERIASALERTSLVSELSKKERGAYNDILPLVKKAKVYLSEHVFSKLRRAAQDAIRQGFDKVNSAELRKWANHFNGATDPHEILEIIDAATTTDAGEMTMVRGKPVRGWGLRDYYPHVWRKDGSPTDPGHVNDPANESIRALARDYMMRAGLAPKEKFFQNLEERMANADGYMRDPFWVLNNYFGRMVDKVTYEKLMTGLEPFMYGEWTESKTDADLINGLNAAPTDKIHERHNAYGSTDEHFGVRVTGDPLNFDYYVLNAEGRWEKQHGISETEAKRLGQLMRNSPMRVHTSFSNHMDWGVGGIEGEGQKVALANANQMFVIKGEESIKEAKLTFRKNGYLNWSSRDSFNGIVDLVKRATGYDIDKMQFIGDGDKPKFVRKIDEAMRAWSNFLYQTQLGGVLNMKAFGVQALMGTVQNMASVGHSALAETIHDFDGFWQYYAHVQAAKNPADAQREAREKFKDTPYVKNVIRVLDEGRVTILSSVQTDQRKFAEMSETGRVLDQAARLSYLGFSAGDIFTKQQLYYAAYKHALDVGAMPDAKGEFRKITPRYIGVDEMFTQSAEISAHDIARQMVDRTHFQLPKWAQPAVLRLPGMGILGHLGIQSSQMTMQLGHDLVKAVHYFKGTGTDLDAFAAGRAARMIGGLMLLYSVGAIAFNRDFGDYVGARVADVGFGGKTLGDAVPALRQLPSWVRMYGFDLPNKESLPVRSLIGDDGEGVPATVSAAVLRSLTGMQSPDESAAMAAQKWWKTWAPTIGLLWATRAAKPAMNIFAAERTDLDPERPYEVREKWWFDPRGGTTYKSGWDLYFKDLWMPGRDFESSSEAARTQAAAALTHQRSEIVAHLRERLVGAETPEERRNIQRKIIEYGGRPDDARNARYAQLMHLPSYVRSAIGNDSTLDKLENFANAAGRWQPAFRAAAFRYILPSGRFPSNVPPALVQRVQEAMQAQE